MARNRAINTTCACSTVYWYLPLICVAERKRYIYLEKPCQSITIIISLGKMKLCGGVGGGGVTGREQLGQKIIKSQMC
jgi:hypothetical protein